jgi:flagellar hook-associated protein 3 FlgL
MRVATSMIFDAGVAAINRQTASLLHLQQQVATGRRILTPSDDPVAAARALEVTQSKDINAQYSTNVDNANSALGLEEGQLTSVNDMFARIKELTVQAGNTTLSSNDRKSIAFELRARFDELLGIANATDGQGQFMFSGYMGSTKPFAGNVDQINALPANEIGYLGDDGQRTLQVSTSRTLEISDSGNDVFKRIRNGNGYFVTNYAATNAGTGIVDAGNVTDPAKWNASTQNFQIKFFVDTSTTPSTTFYDITDAAGTVSMITNGAPLAPPITVASGLPVYHSDQAIMLPDVPGGTTNFGSVMISGAPADGDSFTIAPSTSQSVFKSLATLIKTLESSATLLPADTAKYSNEIGFALTNLDQANDNILRVRAMIGSRMAELDSLDNVNQDLDLQYQQTLSNLQDLDYAKAITDMTRKQTDLEAAQKSFMMTSRLSLFDYLP